MPGMHERIRRARASVNFSQSHLADHIGVKRSAVAQWERKDGPNPTMEHMSRLALVTGVCLEWLGTGRGPATAEAANAAPAMLASDYTQDDLEAECLMAFRRLQLAQRAQVVAIMHVLLKRA
jgi:transcriptional regulator with XRE-family HTH domain